MLGQVWLRKLGEPILGGQPAEIEGDRLLPRSPLAGHDHHAHVCPKVGGGDHQAWLSLNLVESHTPNEIVDRVYVHVYPIGLVMHGNGNLGVQVLKGLIDLAHIKRAMSADRHQHYIYGL